MRIIKVFHRVYVHPDQLNAAIAFYEKLFNCTCSLRFQYPERNLELAGVGSILLLAGQTEALEPVRHTALTVLVDSLDEAQQLLATMGATIEEPPKAVPTGRNLRARHPDGLLVEYVEHTTGN